MLIPLESADDIIVKTYCKKCADMGLICIPDIHVTDISDLLIGGNVKFKSGNETIEQIVNKNELKALINYAGGYTNS